MIQEQLTVCNLISRRGIVPYYNFIRGPLPKRIRELLVAGEPIYLQTTSLVISRNEKICELVIVVDIERIAHKKNCGHLIVEGFTTKESDFPEAAVEMAFFHDRSGLMMFKANQWTLFLS